MMNKKPLSLKKGEEIVLEHEGREVTAFVLMASENGKSLAVAFDAMLGGYVGMMPILFNDEAGEYQDLAIGKPVLIKKIQ